MLRLKFLLLAVLGLLVACGTPATPSAPTTAPTSAPTVAATSAPPSAATAAPTTAPTTAPTAAPTSPPAASFKGDKLAAPDCNYGSADNPGEFKSIEATEANTVVMTLCHPDPAFPDKVAFIAFGI